MTMTIVVVVLSLALIAQTVVHAVERRDLYNRIMARDLTEYELSKTKGSKKDVKPKTNYFKKNMDRAYNEQQGFKSDE